MQSLDPHTRKDGAFRKILEIWCCFMFVSLKMLLKVSAEHQQIRRIRWSLFVCHSEFQSLVQVKGTFQIWLASSRLKTCHCVCAEERTTPTGRTCAEPCWIFGTSSTKPKITSNNQREVCFSAKKIWFDNSSKSNGSTNGMKNVMKASGP